MPHTPPELLPRKCQKCVKTTRPTIHAKFSLCQELGFEEEVLCHLNRNTKPNDIPVLCFSAHIEAAGRTRPNAFRSKRKC